MPKALTIRTDETTLDRLEALARATERSRNFHAREALRRYLEDHDTGSAPAKDRRDPLAGPVAEDLDDYRSRFWTEDDLDELLAFLAAQRRLGRDRDRLAELP